MKVSELREALKDLPDDMLVVLSKDPEGNSYDILHYVGSGWGYEDREIAVLKLNDEFKDEGFTEEDVQSDWTPCVVLLP